MLITKASGDKVKFNRKGYEDSLKRVGLSLAEAKEISSQVYQDLYPDVSSEIIFQKTHLILKKKNKIFAAKYSLKRAIMNLGPGGYFFERYVAAVLAYYGYQTKFNQFVWGRCVEHELDIVAERDHKKFLVECKFHQQSGQASDLKVALYTWARFLDLKEAQKFYEPVLITNTRCTSEAIKYAQCVGLKIIAWRYPSGQENLEHYIESKKLYPVTVLTSLTNYLNKRFREENIVLVQQLLKFTPKVLAKKFRVNEGLASRLIGEAEALVTHS